MCTRIHGTYPILNTFYGIIVVAVNHPCDHTIYKLVYAFGEPEES